MAIIDTDTEVRTSFDDDVAATQRYFDGPRFDGITRLYTARQVAEQRGTIPTDYPVARNAAVAFYERLRELFAEKKSITTFGPYSPGQAVSMKRMGIEGIYLGGWATSAKGSTTWMLAGALPCFSSPPMMALAMLPPPMKAMREFVSAVVMFIPGIRRPRTG